MSKLEAAGFRPEYLAVREARTLGEPAPDCRRLIVMAAAWLGGTRLIDNVMVEGDSGCRRRKLPGTGDPGCYDGPIVGVEGSIEMTLNRTLLGAVAGGLMLAMAGTAAAQSTLRVVMHSDLKIVDPIWTTAYISRNYGYLVYDTLFALDEQLDGAAADGRILRDQRRQSHLHLHPARRALVARRPAGDA